MPGGKIQYVGPFKAAFQQTKIADATAITGGESPTEAEHNALVTKINAILDILEDSKIMKAT